MPDRCESCRCAGRDGWGRSWHHLEWNVAVVGVAAESEVVRRSLLGLRCTRGVVLLRSAVTSAATAQHDVGDVDLGEVFFLAVLLDDVGTDRPLDGETIPLAEDLREPFGTLAPHGAVQELCAFLTRVVSVEVALTTREPQLQYALAAWRDAQFAVSAKVADSDPLVHPIAHPNAPSGSAAAPFSCARCVAAFSSSSSGVRPSAAAAASHRSHQDDSRRPYLSCSSRRARADASSATRYVDSWLRNPSTVSSCVPPFSRRILSNAGTAS